MQGRGGLLGIDGQNLRIFSACALFRSFFTHIMDNATIRQADKQSTLV
jgi:hypothetical protein